MKFIDEAEIEVEAGKGGSGCKHFRREKFVPYGGPDGGNGGAGGSVVLLADRNRHTLLDFKFQPRWKAENGKPGQGSRKDGRCGEDLVIRVPVGTEVFGTDSSDTPVVDLTFDGQRFVLAQGGRGGKGNWYFKSATNRVPSQFQPGEEGEAGTFRLSLKLVADVGLVGLPNAGKSTLISRISAATPKIADYPFTTLEPNLGVVQAKPGKSFVVADIPGLIPGAHLGKGLGVGFLKHLERTRVLAHLIDPFQLDEDGSPLDPIAAFERISVELEEFSPELAAKPQVVVLTKADLCSEQEALQSHQKTFADRGLFCLTISSATGAGLDSLLVELLRQLESCSELDLAAG